VCFSELGSEYRLCLLHSIVKNSEEPVSYFFLHFDSVQETMCPAHKTIFILQQIRLFMYGFI
jgi:hypothetical protein